VRAVGTAFNVRMASNTVEVLVTEGAVRLGEVNRGSAGPAAPKAAAGREVLAQPLVAGERAVVRTLADAAKAPVTVDKPAPTEIAETLAWESTRLVFDHTPLDQVVAAFNRYNVRQLALAEPSLRARTLTGVFRADTSTASYASCAPAWT